MGWIRVLAKGFVFFSAGVAGKKFHQSFVGALVLVKDGVDGVEDRSHRARAASGFIGRPAAPTRAEPVHRPLGRVISNQRIHKAPTAGGLRGCGRGNGFSK
jgi:hypothetical protein